MHYNLVKKASRAYLEEISNRINQMPLIYECINLLQDTQFKINNKVLDVAKSIWDKGLTVGKIPAKYNLDVPPKPHDIADNKQARIDWSRRKKAICEYNASLNSQRILFAKVFEIASTYQPFPSIQFPCQYDYRFRLYCVPQFFNYQNGDLPKALLLFTEGKPLETDEALARLAIHGANCYGEVDKDTLEKRVEWVDKYEKQILDTAKDPHNHYSFWGSCSEPFQFLAFCFEWEAFVNAGRTADFVTHLPCYSDCTNSGLQIFSGLLADERGGKATNLTPENKPQDVYKEVAEEVLRLLKEEPDTQLKQMWIEYGINRYTTKKVTMCVVYGLTQFSCRKYIEEYIKENEDDGIPNPFSTDKNPREGKPKLFIATAYLSRIVWKALDNVIVSAKEAMSWLQQVSKLVAQNNLPITWTTPNGAIVQMVCPVMKTKRVNTNMGEKIWRPKLNKYVSDIKKTTMQVPTNKIDAHKVSNSISPSFVHSLDGAILQLAVCKASKKGVKNFATIHDSYGVLATDMNTMNDCVKQSFFEIFNNKNLLEDFLNEIKPQIAEDKHKYIPALPKKRNLDLSLLLKSNYFCS